MNNKERKRKIAYEALILLGMQALLLYITRLWPLLLLVLLGIFVATLRLLFLSVKDVKEIEPAPLLPMPYEPTEKDLYDLAYGTMLRRITELVCASYPEARWVWDTPNARACISEGSDAYIRLNRAGGYRRAKVIVRNLCVQAIEYEQQKADTAEAAVETEPQVETAPAGEAVSEPKSSEPMQAENYEYLAFEWFEAHALELNERCNECIADGSFTLILGEEDLPEPESWPDICRTLEQNSVGTCKCSELGILIDLKQENCRKD